MQEKEYACILVNFGGPRNLEEIPSFLKELLSDQEVIRTPLPGFLHRLIFSRVARKRAQKIREDYALIGGKSPIYEDTEMLASALKKRLGVEVLSFHRYLKSTHAAFLLKLEQLSAKELRILPLFPQFSYATTGSIAKFFSQKISKDSLQKMFWIKSYPCHHNYIQSMEKVIRNFLSENSLSEEETLFLFSAHGLPEKFIATGDIYQKECETSFCYIKGLFPKVESLLSYQSQFGKEVWISPATETLCNTLTTERKNVVLIPLSFTSDHIETLFEIEHLYLPILRARGFSAFRCPALNQDENWIQSLTEIVNDPSLLVTTPMLVRHKSIVPES